VKPGKAAADAAWAPTGPVEYPWYPDWTVQAACRGEYGPPGDDPFFDFSAQHEETRRAKAICYGCPVRLRCLRENLWVPFGIWGGYTERERRAMRGEQRDRSVQIMFFKHQLEAG